MIATIAVLTTVNIAGIGGGGTMVPTSQGFFNFDPKNAIAISNISITLSSTIRYILTAWKHHPLKNGKGLLIDMNLALIMLPMVVSGVSFGVIANINVPSIVIIACYALFLVLIGIQLFLKAYGLYQFEIHNDKLPALELSNIT